MSAPLVWIFFPLVISIVLLFIPGKPKLQFVIGLGVCSFLTLVALFQPLGTVIQIGPFSIEFKNDLSVFGRTFTLPRSDQYYLSVVYFALSLFIGGSRVAELPQKFIPLSMAIVSFLTAALSVQPFLYSAIFIEMAAIVVIPFVMEKDRTPGKGVLRFLIYQTLAMPLILIAGWLLSGIEASPSDTARLTQAALFLGVGFAFWLAVFPFHSWVSQFSQETPPYITGFILGLLPMTSLIIMLDYISGLVWLRSAAYLSPVLSNVGIIMIVTGGVWAAIEKDVRRLFGYVIIFQSGFALTMISLQTIGGVELLYQTFLPRIMAISVYALSAAILANQSVDLTLSGISGQMRKNPFSAVGLIVSFITLAGFPLFALFPIQLELIRQISRASVSSLIWIMLGFGGMIFAVLRVLSVLTIPPSGKRQVNEKIPQIVLLGIGIVLLVIMGWFPNLIFTLSSDLFTELPILR